MIITWEAVTAMAVIVGSTLGGFWFLIVIAINSAMDRMRVDLIRELNGTYIRRGECGLIREDVERRLTSLEEKV